MSDIERVADSDRPRHRSLRPTRRDVLALGVGAFIVTALPVALRGRRRLVRRAVPVMGTTAEFAVVDDDPRRAHIAIDEAVAALRRVDAGMSRFRDDSDIGRANACAAAEPVAVTRPTADVLATSLRWAEASDGLFDPCLGRAVGLWDVGARHAPPTDTLVRPLAGRRLYRHLDLDTWRGRDVVRFAESDVALDLGGIAKGFAVDRAAEALRARGVRDALVNVGGDLRAVGASEDGDPWSVGIRCPDDPARIRRTLDVRDAAVATSGDYAQFFEHGGRRYHHLLDPRTAAPRRSGARSLTIVAATCLTADAAATALFGAEPARARSLLGRLAPDARIEDRA